MSAVSRRLARPTVLQLALFLAGAGAVASAAPVGAAIASVHRAYAAVGRLRLVGVAFSYPRLNAPAWVLLGLALIGASAIAVALRAALRQRRAYRRFLARVEVVGRLGDRAEVQVIADPRPQAFCAGYLRPTVYISQTALELLGDEELEAVLAHEHYHRRVRDPLRFACGRILGRALFFVPALAILFRRYIDLTELNADGAAVRAGAGGRAALASALLAFENSGVGISPERVDSLLGHPVAWRRPWWLLAASLGSVLSLIALTWGASQAASARATFNLPFVSAQPCLVMLTTLPLLGVLVVLARRVARRRAGRRG
jgi:Zn-dependent protease with chaperone function